MPRPKLRTRKRKRRTVSLPGGSSTISYTNKKASGPKCSRCGGELAFPSRSTSNIHQLPKNQKRVSRMYGGRLCHSCLRDLLKQATRTS
ncbi:MAG: 50S ribosomal protein L34e [Candidatus Bathyarchaeia archaeon]